MKENEGYKPDVVVQLRPTSPIRPRDCVDKAVRILLDHPDADCVRGVVPAGQNPHKMWRIGDGNEPMTPLLQVAGIPEPYNAPRQSLPQIYWQTGHVDAIRTATICEKGSMTGERIYPLLIEPLLRWQTPDSIDRFFPVKSMDQINVFPFQKYFGVSVQSHIPYDSTVIASCWIFIFIFSSYLLLKRSDL